ncbi:aldehyde dehydrogenase family protein (plasmid) [Rhodococcus sp. USK10]|uniref:aldehyde dehydrogenase family protein n=1 Tax=Rhodococcus sp. USK10 TaxID=2789739 RepID=UPI001C5F8E12|nr:aldehyde dehydrogenase family protein [Rhodococcus sp. USK10]QYB00588.1 aldehyde dehydrogenase family protein [Rhodococcus sp. USK10]
MTSVASNSNSAPSELGTVAHADATFPADAVNTVVHRLRRTFDTGRTGSARWRERQLDALSRLLSENAKQIQAALATDLGRPAADAWLADIAAVQLEIKTARRNLKKWMGETKVRLPLSQLPGVGRIRREPLGVVLIIGPWNYPFYLTLGPLVGALAAGNCAVIKPSEYAAASSALLAQLIPRYMDADAVEVVEGSVPETAAVIDQRVDHIFFTGSPAVGQRIMAAAAPHLTPVTLELGGKSPVIVTDDADIEVAARRIIWAKLMNSGQTCIAPDYVLVAKSVAPALINAMIDTLARFRPGPDSALPILDRRQFDRIVALLANHGGTVVSGGGVDESAVTIEPTIILDPSVTAPVMQEEIFGPVLPVIPVDTLDHAIDFIRGREKPLAVYLFSPSRRAANRVIAETSSGGVVVNHIGLHCMAPNLPFGGVGNSGMGSYHGRWGFETFSHRKSLVSTKTRPDLPILYPPVTALKERILRLFF